MFILVLLNMSLKLILWLLNVLVINWWLYCNIKSNFILIFFELKFVDMHNEEIIIELNKNHFEILLKYYLNFMKKMLLMILIFIMFNCYTFLMNSLMNLFFNELSIIIFDLFLLFIIKLLWCECYSIKSFKIFILIKLIKSWIFLHLIWFY
jgi:hypothetical protein